MLRSSAQCVCKMEPMSSYRCFICMAADQEYQVGVEEVDAADVSNKEAEGLNKRGKQFLEVRKALEMPTQDTGTARERKLAKRSVLETKPAAVNSVSRGRESSARVPWEYIQSEREFEQS